MSLSHPMMHHNATDPSAPPGAFDPAEAEDASRALDQKILTGVCRMGSSDIRNSGGEGGIRTPDTLTSMPDFESGAFNRALPPLRFVLPVTSAPADHFAPAFCILRVAAATTDQVRCVSSRMIYARCHKSTKCRRFRDCRERSHPPIEPGRQAPDE